VFLGFSFCSGFLPCGEILILDFYFCFIMFLLFVVCMLVWVWSLTWKDLLDNGWFINVVLVLWLVSAFFVAWLLTRVDWIVHHELYSFGLEFSLDWALDYWAAVRAIYMFLVVPIVFSVGYFCLEVWRFLRGRGGGIVKVKPVEPVKPISRGVRTAEQNHMLISCPKCRRVFGKPLVMLDFSGGKTRLVNVCPYCNHVLGCAEEDKGENEDGEMGLFDLDKRKVEQK
jgi:uncharacterized Zn-finger protein